jgi:hypothetical protein
VAGKANWLYDLIVMNARMLPAWSAGLVAALLMSPATGGLAQNESNHSSVFSSETAAAVARAPAAPGIAPFSLTNAASPSNPPPSKVRLSPWTTEIVKLARAGIEDTVILSFVENTPGTFNLGADQIIYLHDLGVAGEFVNAMIQHDSEVALGIRPVPASTVPESEPALQLTGIAGGDAGGQGSKQSAIVPAVPAPASGETVDKRSGQASLQTDFGIATAEPLESDYLPGDEIEAGSTTASAQPRPAAAQALYPVREPYPVELTGPIIVFQAWSRPPNTLVIRFGP